MGEGGGHWPCGGGAVAGWVLPLERGPFRWLGSYVFVLQPATSLLHKERLSLGGRLKLLQGAFASRDSQRHLAYRCVRPSLFALRSPALVGDSFLGNGVSTALLEEH